jgi:hypothetical protein
MATVLTRSSPRPGIPGATHTTDPGPGWVVWSLLACSACIIVGLLWDISWHMSIGRDRLWSAPHVLEQIGAGLAGILCGFVVLRTTFAGSTTERDRSVRFWGFRGPIGGWVAIWGAFAMIFSVPFDDWWHNAYGLDVEILSPPHVVLLSGMIAIQLGAMLLALGMQNRSSGRTRERFGLAFAIAAGALIAMAGTAVAEYTLFQNRWHSMLTYEVTALIFPIFLVAVGRAGSIRYPATKAAALYMTFYLVTQWVIVQFPATPRLTPILNPLTNMAAFGFPMLLIAPAIGIDLLIRRGNSGDWRLAALIGPAFVLLLLAAQWPFASFLVKSPLAQNDLFLANHWAYTNSPGPYMHQFFGDNLSPDGSLIVGDMLKGLLIAIVIATLTTRVGLAWGGWMKRVQR